MKLGEVGLPTWLEGVDVSFILSAVLPVWVFGAMIGLLVGVTRESLPPGLTLLL